MKKITTKTVYPQTITQVTTLGFTTFSNLAQIKNNSGQYAYSSGLIHGKKSSPNRPSSITCTNFKANLPTGAEVTSVTVEYEHAKVAYQGQVCNIPAPLIQLLTTGKEAKGAAPTTSWKKNSKTFNVALTRDKVNATNFGVRLVYYANTNNQEGYMRVRYIRLKINYLVPSYSFGIKKTSGGYVGDNYQVAITLNNKNKTAYNPSVTITLPTGINYVSFKGNGKVVKSGSNLVWTPAFKKGTVSNTISVVLSTDVMTGSSTTYSGTLSAKVGLTGTTGTHTISLSKKPASVVQDETVYDEDDVNDDSRNSVDTTSEDTTLNSQDIIRECELFSLKFKVDTEIVDQLVDGDYLELSAWSGNTNISDYFVVNPIRRYTQVDEDDPVIEEIDLTNLNESDRLVVGAEDTSSETVDGTLVTTVSGVTSDSYLDNYAFTEDDFDATGLLKVSLFIFKDTFVNDITDVTFKAAVISPSGNDIVGGS